MSVLLVRLLTKAILPPLGDQLGSPSPAELLVRVRVPVLGDPLPPVALGGPQRLFAGHGQGGVRDSHGILVLLVGPPPAGFPRRTLEELAEVLLDGIDCREARATTLSLAALASTALESKNSSSPHTRPA